MSAHFTPDLFDFLRQLRENNQRDWFQAHKERYEDSVKEPLLAFISDFGPHLKKISKHFAADPRPVGGSMFRIYRDVRFSKDKSPYKTAASAHFKHHRAKDVHAPGFYLHLEPGQVFAGAGIWRPAGPAVKAIRGAIVERSADWEKMVANRRTRQLGGVTGDSLKRPPRGFDPEHPLVEDLKRKDFLVDFYFTEADAVEADFLDRFVSFCRSATPLMKFLTEALEVEF